MGSFGLMNQIKLQYDHQRIDSLIKSEYCYTHEWMCIENQLYGFGVNEQGIQVYINPTIKFGLYCMVQLESHLTIFNEVSYITCIEHIPQTSIKPTTTIFHSISNDDDNEWKMYKLHINEFSNTKKLFSFLSNPDNYTLNNYIKVPCVWNLETFILMEMIVNNESKQNCYFVWIDDNLKIISNKQQPPLPTIIAYDFETVSPDTNRIPIGNIYSDILFSASIIICTTTRRQLYSLLYLPVDVDGDIDENLESHLKTRISKLNKKNDYKGIDEQKILFFNNEKDLVKKCLELFDREEFYIAIGFNSKTYDLPFLMRRCAYLLLPELKNFYINQDIVTYKFNMTHIDLLLLYRKYYSELGQYISLNKISKICLKETKVDVNAVNIRFMFEEMYNSNTLDLDKVYKNDVTLDSCVYYNDVDTLLLLKLWFNVGYHTSIQDICRSYDISLIRVSQSKVNEYISVRVFKQALSFQNFLTHNHSNCVLYNDVILDYDKIVKSSDTNESFMGGFNYRSPKTMHENINAMDYVAYYPYIINGFNLSYETVTIIPLSILKKIIEHKEKNISFENIKFYRFINHKGNTDTETIYQSREFINKTKDHGAILNYNQIITLIQTTSDHDADNVLILMILMNKRGLLSNIIEHQNNLRDLVKQKTKELSQRLVVVRNFISIQSSIENNAAEETIEDHDDENNNNEFDFDIDFDAVDDEENENNENNDNDGNNNCDFDIDFDAMDDDENNENNTVDTIDANNHDDEEDEEDEGSKFSIINDDMKMIEFKIDISKDLSSMSLFELQQYYDELLCESTRIESIYRTLKIVNSSMYGCLGAKLYFNEKTNYKSAVSLRGVHVAAAVTFLGRYYILEAAHHGLEHNYECVFIDTDSVFLTKKESLYENKKKDSNNCNDDENEHDVVPQYVRNINENLQLTVKSYPFISIFAKKRYIVQKENGETFSKSITKNGPKLWTMIIEKLSVKYLFQNYTTYEKISEIFDEIFEFTYNYLEQYGNSFILVNRNAKEAAEKYVTETPLKRLMMYIRDRYPEYTKVTKSLSFFYYVDNGSDVNDITLRPEFELDTTHAKHFNLFKFYSSIFKSIFDILNISVTTNFEQKGIYIILDEKEIFKLFKFSFIKVRNCRFELKTPYLAKRAKIV